MSVKFLDLDAINVPIGTVKIAEKTYEIYPLTVKNIVNLSEVEGTLDETSVGDQVRMSIDILCEVVQGISRDEVEKLSITQLNELMNWLQSLGEEVAEKNSKPALARRKGQSR